MYENNKIFFIAGPCVIESRAFLHECADFLCNIFRENNVQFILKSSFYKANRTSYSSYRGPGIDDGLVILNDVKEKYNIKITTDIHETWQANPVAQVADIIQIPARLCQQTNLIESAAITGKSINFKKGQFIAPHDMKFVVEKARHISQNNFHKSIDYFVTERGTFYGENKLIVDMRSLGIMKKCTNCPIIYDASHSIQLPGSLRGSSGGEIEHFSDLACAAIATGHVSGIFFETHPNPGDALCDGPIQLPFSQVSSFLQRIISLYKSVYDLIT